MKPLPHDADLTWYFCEAESAAGVACPLGALMSETARSSGGTPQPDRKMTDWRIGWPGRKEAHGKPEDVRRQRETEPHVPSAVTRARSLRARLMSLSQKHQDVLWLAYGPHAWPVGLSALGGLAGVTLVTHALAARHARSVTIAAPGPWFISSIRRSHEAVAPIGPTLSREAKKTRESLNIAIARAKEDVPAIVQEAEALVSAAVEAWKATAPKARRRAPRQFVYREGAREK